MTDKPMTQTELQLRHDAYWDEVSKRPTDPWIQALINKTYEIVNFNVSCSDDTPRDTRGGVYDKSISTS